MSTKAVCLQYDSYMLTNNNNDSCSGEAADGINLGSSWIRHNMYRLFVESYFFKCVVSVEMVDNQVKSIVLKT